MEKDEITRISEEAFGTGTVTGGQLLETLLENEMNHLHNTLYSLLMQRQSHFSPGTPEYKRVWRLLDDLVIVRNSESSRLQLISVIAQL